MKSLLSVLVVGLVSVGAASADQGRGNSEGRGKGPDKVATRGADKDNKADKNRSVVFAPRDITILRNHYGPQYRNLPPGLQKKLARGGTLPPGWQKKMQPFPAQLDRDLGPLPGGYRRGVIDGHAVIYNPITHAIADIATLF